MESLFWIFFGLLCFFVFSLASLKGRKIRQENRRLASTSAVIIASRHPNPSHGPYFVPVQISTVSNHNFATSTIPMNGPITYSNFPTNASMTNHNIYNLPPSYNQAVSSAVSPSVHQAEGKTVSST
ncbi:CLUMA_CG005340, isoform A [Clunio marinus]|uniref:CLUMA_CG005340, isoform A n=1 Tax=Clunio marinus TaxID=568069 RepID=A0A1J1HUK7_9DIPT|nr:CLUMA_CG005340, isoform A [Clunio marinus]